jgi:hypothetical protein
MHPAGTTYFNIYDGLDCYGRNICPTWLTPDVAVREEADRRGALQNAALEQLIRDAKADNRYPSLRLLYVPCPIDTIIAETPADQVWTLVEPSDGFHPNDAALAREAEIVWDMLVEAFPDALGPDAANPHNDEISARFLQNFTTREW